MTVGQIIKEFQDAEKLETMSPQELSIKLVYLSSMIYVAGNEVINAEKNYADKWGFIYN